MECVERESQWTRERERDKLLLLSFNCRRRQRMRQRMKERRVKERKISREASCVCSLLVCHRLLTGVTFSIVLHTSCESLLKKEMMMIFAGQTDQQIAKVIHQWQRKGHTFYSCHLNLEFMENFIHVSYYSRREDLSSDLGQKRCRFLLWRRTWNFGRRSQSGFYFQMNWMIATASPSRFSLQEKERERVNKGEHVL